MDFLKFDNLKTENKLIDLAFQRYFDDLNICTLYSLKFKKDNRNKWIEDINNSILKYMPNMFKDLDSNNPANFDPLVCYKLLLCSSKISPWWGIQYSNLYKYFYSSKKENSKLNIDIFIGKIEELFDNNNDIEFKSFEKLINLKYKKIKKILWIF